jgi:hypothetical protein
MEESANHIEIRTQITANWLMALEHLKETGRVRSDRKFEEETGIRGQRISEMRKFIETKERSSYASVDQVIVLHDQFGVSLDYIMKGELPIIPVKKENIIENASQGSVPDHQNGQSELKLEVKRIADLIVLFEKKIEFLEKKIDAK